MLSECFCFSFGYFLCTRSLQFIRESALKNVKWLNRSKEKPPFSTRYKAYMQLCRRHQLSIKLWIYCLKKMFTSLFCFDSVNFLEIITLDVETFRSFCILSYTGMQILTRKQPRSFEVDQFNRISGNCSGVHADRPWSWFREPTLHKSEILWVRQSDVGIAF